jgi:hypothetical protein
MRRNGHGRAGRLAEEQAPSKTGPSGVGRDLYSWYQMQVHYLPMDFDREYALLERELDRAWSTLALEEHRNRELPGAEAGEQPRGLPAARRRNRRADDGLVRGGRHPAHARLHGRGTRRPPGPLPAAGSAQLLHHRHALRSATPVLALLPLVRPGRDGHLPPCQPDPPRSAALQHLRLAQRGHGDGRGGDVHARRPLRRVAALARARLDHARAARRAWPRLPCTPTPTR